MNNMDIDVILAGKRIEHNGEIATEIWNFYKSWVSPNKSIEDDNFVSKYRAQFNNEVENLRKKYENNRFAQRLLDVFLLELRGE